MSRKAIITVGAVIGSIAGGYLTTLFGAGSISFWSLLGSTVGGLAGIYLAFRFTS